MQRSPAEGIDRLIHIRVRHHDHVVLRATEALHSLSVRSAARIDVFRDRRGADKADGADIGIVQDRVDRDLVAVHDVEDPGRETCFDHQFSQSHGHTRVAFGRFQDECVAAGDRRGELPHRNHCREVERRDSGDDTERLPHRVEIDTGPGTFRIFALHQLRDAASKFDDLKPALDIAASIADGLAMLAREQVGELVIFLLDQLHELEHYAGATLRIGRRPGRLRGLRILDRGTHLGGGGEGDLADHLAGHRLEHVACASGYALYLLSADEMTDLAHLAALPSPYGPCPVVRIFSVPSADVPLAKGRNPRGAPAKR
jgi:hypothetical protein